MVKLECYRNFGENNGGVTESGAMSFTPPLGGWGERGFLILSFGGKYAFAFVLKQ